MSPVDALSPPQKKKKAPPPKKPKVNQEKKEPVAKQPLAQEAKKRLLWILVSLTAFLILVAWIFLFQGGQLFSSSTGSDFFGTAGQKLTNLWQTIKTDILKLQETLNNSNTNAEEEKIKQLEEQVFPQFTDPTKQ